MCLFILKAGRWSWESKSTTPPALDKKLSLSNKSFSKCNFVDICDDAVIKGSFSYRWGGKILLLLEVNGECREWRMPWAENVLGVLIFSAAVTFWYLCAEQHSNGHSYVIKFGDVTPNDQTGRILGTMESIENLRHFQFRFWENCFERRMPWVEYAVSVESSHFHFAFSIQILWDSWSSANKDPSQLKWKALLIFWFQF